MLLHTEIFTRCQLAIAKPILPCVGTKIYNIEYNKRVHGLGIGRQIVTNKTMFLVDKSIRSILYVEISQSITFI